MGMSDGDRWTGADGYLVALKWLSALVSITLWALSAYFSSRGFQIAVPEQAWVGWVLAISITIIEIVWNHEGFGHNTTIIVAGLACYVYGVWSNIVGIMGAQGAANFLQEILANPMKVVLPVCIGVLLEITPEPLLLWAIVGSHTDDILSHLIGRGQRVFGQRQQPQRAQLKPIGQPSMQRNMGRQPFGPRVQNGPRVPVEQQEESDIKYHFLNR